jgi:signal peptidase I
MCRILRIQGDSLNPEYQDGDFLLISKIPIFLNMVHPGDLVVFHQPGYGTLVKKIEKFTPDRQNIYVFGLTPESVDSRIFGHVRKSDLVGKVIWHFR